MQPAGILETVLYAKDLAATETFYRDVLGLEPFVRAAGRHLFYRCGNQVLLIFNPEATSVPPAPGALPVPPHGMKGEGHVCFRASADRDRCLEIAPASPRASPSRPTSSGPRRPLDLLPRSRRQLPGVRRAEDLEARMMRRLQRGTRLVVASHNPGKVREIYDLVAPYGLRAGVGRRARSASPRRPGRPSPAMPSSRRCLRAGAAAARRCPTTSGLEVEALDGAPGIYSARWAGPQKDFGWPCSGSADEVARPRLARPARQLHRRALPGLARTGRSHVFEGKVYGHLVWPPRGTRGFGYDPMFVADGETLTFGEMEPAAKHAISHRARAFKLFVAACLECGG